MGRYYYVYALLSKKDKKFYTGYTNNLILRFEQHQLGRVESTKLRGPFIPVYYEACLSKKDAIH
ncbi:MAG TPA: GIY-YIG nuclease family protein [Candidatus Paceibacterota bacterium]